MSSLFFVLGRGRSGTTLLSRMLGQHPEVVVAPEGFFAMNLRRRYGTGPLAPSRVDAFVRDVLAENRMKTWGLSPADLQRRLRSNGGALPYAEVCTRVYESYAHGTVGKRQARLLGDKNPHYALLVERLLETFPEARFIHLVRDPRDNVLSYRAVPFDLGDVRALAYRWRAYNTRLLRAQGLAPQRFLRIRYEDLIRGPAPVLAQVSAFLGLPYEAAMLAFHEHDDGAFYGKGSAWFEKLQGPLDPDQAEKWRTGLSADEASQVEAICGPLMDWFGYERSAEDLALRSLPQTLSGVTAGALSVVAEDLIFAALPTRARIALINRYRKQSGRI